MRLALGLACLVLVTGETTEADVEGWSSEPGDWQYGRMTYTRNAKPMASGWIAYVQSKDGRGVAFRCDKRILYALVAVEPFDFRANMVRLGDTRKNWNVTAQVGDYPAREEKWVSIHGGDVLMARRISTTNRIFYGAKNGVTVTIEDRTGLLGVVDIPEDTTGVLDVFESECNLREEFAAPDPVI